jgi:hypothetical protein
LGTHPGHGGVGGAEIDAECAGGGRGHEGVYGRSGQGLW